MTCALVDQERNIRNVMENELEGKIDTRVESEERIVDGVKYRKVFSGYTVRQYFSHSTPEKGPGPGWDTRRETLEKYHTNESSELPYEPYYIWEEV